MSYYRGRLWLLGGDRAAASVVNERYNFFQSSALLLADDDPIDGYVDLHEHAETIHSAVPTDTGLLVFTRRGQYTITAQGIMSPTTFEFKEVSKYASDHRVTPQAVGDRVSFVTQRSNYAALQESYAVDAGISRKASDVSSHVPEYIRGNVQSILAASGVNTQFLVMRDSANNPTDTLYVYDYLRDGNERIQSAWSQWTFSGQVVDGILTGDALVLLMRRQDVTKDAAGSAVLGSSYYTIERIELISDSLRNEVGHPIYLDCRQHSLTEPTDLREGEEKKCFQKVWYRGFPYMQSYTFSPFFMRPQGKTTGDTGGRLQLRRLVLNYRQTTMFKVRIYTTGRETREIFFQGRKLGDSNNRIGVIPVVEGKHSFPLLGASESITVSLENYSPFEASFQSGYWEGFYHNRARRYS
ncbi:phage nozzle protein [Candidatus Enterovibrio escicola]